MTSNDGTPVAPGAPGASASVAPSELGELSESGAPVALTGATGFIGRHLLAALGEAGIPVRTLQRRRPGAATPPENSTAGGAGGTGGTGGTAPAGVTAAADVTTVYGDLADARALASLVQGARAVVHLAGAIRGRGPEVFERVNVEGTGAVVEALRTHAPDAHLVMVSSLAAREPGLSWYAASKRHAEARVQKAAPGWTVLRPPAVYGPGDPALAPLWRGLARGWLVRIGPAAARFSLLHVADLVETILRLLRLPQATGQVLALHDGRDGGYDWATLAALAAAARGGRVRTLAVPAPMLRAAAAINAGAARVLRYEPMLTPAKARELRHPDWVCDNFQLLQALDWAPQKTLEHTLHTLPGWNR